MSFNKESKIEVDLFLILYLHTHVPHTLTYTHTHTHTHTRVCIHTSRGVHDIMVVTIENGHGETSSNPGQDWLHFT